MYKKVTKNKYNWTKFDRGVFLVNVLGIIYDSETKKILIGKRKNDPYIKKLSWTFPGGRPEYKKDLDYYLKYNIKIKTGLDIKVKKIIFAKTYSEKREFLSIYYLCEIVGGKEKPGEKFSEIKWIKPAEVKKYFTTSLHLQLFKYLKILK